MPDLKIDIPTAAVFSHPNHELPIFGIVQRLQPALLYLTDGGGAERVKETLNGLESIGWRRPMEFLNFTEESFYNALLKRDNGFFRELAMRVREQLRVWNVRRIFCDAAEFYNPIHDVGLPVVRNALAGADCEIFEVPLVHQKPGDGEAYEFQRASESRKAQEIQIELDDREYGRKIHAWESIYNRLREMVGPLVGDCARFRTETVIPAGRGLPQPRADCPVRYEWRGEKLKGEGKVEGVITYAEHYAPTMMGVL